MLRVIIAGTVGMIVGVVLSKLVASKIKHADNQNTLKTSKFLLVIGCTCVICVAFLCYLLAVYPSLNAKTSQFCILVIMILFFSASAVYSVGEYTRIDGRYDNESIQLSSPWSGQKNALWHDLESVKFNALGSWHTLNFKDGTIIRLSIFIVGYGKVLEKLDSKAMA